MGPGSWHCVAVVAFKRSKKLRSELSANFRTASFLFCNRILLQLVQKSCAILLIEAFRY